MLPGQNACALSSRLAKMITANKMSIIRQRSDNRLNCHFAIKHLDLI